MDQLDWRLAARCRQKPEEMFVVGADQRVQRKTCLPCPVRTECLAYALDHRIEFGVWGGATERERRHILRRRPDVDSWANLLDSARRSAKSA